MLSWWARRFAGQFFIGLASLTERSSSRTLATAGFEQSFLMKLKLVLSSRDVRAWGVEKVIGAVFVRHFNRTFLSVFIGLQSCAASLKRDLEVVRNTKNILNE
jgi:hypothetical protein